jgi:hypothetical protein
MVAECGRGAGPGFHVAAPVRHALEWEFAMGWNTH